jgi:hypothetical protein
MFRHKVKNEREKNISPWQRTEQNWFFSFLYIAHIIANRNGYDLYLILHAQLGDSEASKHDSMPDSFDSSEYNMSVGVWVFRFIHTQHPHSCSFKDIHWICSCKTLHCFQTVKEKKKGNN